MSCSRYLELHQFLLLGLWVFPILNKITCTQYKPAGCEAAVLSSSGVGVKRLKCRKDVGGGYWLHFPSVVEF